MNHEEMNQRFSRLENEIAELNKKLSVLMPSEDANKRCDEQFAAFYDDCIKIARRTFAKILQEKFLPAALSEKYSITVKSAGEEGNKRYFIASAPDKDQEWECNRPSFVVSGDDGKITISENGKVTPPSHQHSETLIEFAIDYLKNNKKQGLMKRIGRCMGYLQLAAEIEALASGADRDAAVREALLCDFNTPPFKKEPDGWIQPGLTYLKWRI
ncbi:hypothetical protein ACI28F_005392 [Escherichia coli]|uniref:hypothetical protein n=1 Tax=Escherichia coli TaxID=562 RepID=UPI00053B103B|nr:hypothetical protein [Escherichia coli]HBC2947302.1 hypothetical protein [Escherichia coli O146]HDQ6611285.1 hypothetical protein [Escherichia coli Ou:H21]HDQ6656608.1 hypothetical protein [Escherichia coli O22:H16]HDQ6701459.1 hypothetical protein [Escherichia coli O174:H8]HDQ6714062.1 hypothetical protein [Escherichia coli O113:H4]HDQ6721025.1 hypothetical protein [Escherichia coli O146:H21]HDQ6768606.1 hypothetical protein [Escherichia coli O128:H2]HDQ6942600.1 hypothetical protein [E